MNKQKIVFYISSHGFGHITRCIAIIEELLQDCEMLIDIVSGERQIEFAKAYLSEYNNRVQYTCLNTDIGLINFEGTIRVDTKKLEQLLRAFLDNLPRVVKEEVYRIKDHNIKLIISDISIIGPEVAQLIGVRCIAITNFLWTTQYEGLKLHKSIIEEFNESYSKIHNVINYELSLLSNLEDDGGFKAGFISRKFDESRIKKIKNELGKILLITVGKSANIENIKVKNFNGTIITTQGVDVTYSGEVIKLPLMTLDTHNYIAASDIIITKAGWGTIAESVLSRKPMVLIERDDVIEDTHNINQLKKNKLAISITENDIKVIDYKELELKIKLGIDRNNRTKYKNETELLTNYILDIKRG